MRVTVFRVGTGIGDGESSKFTSTSIFLNYMVGETLNLSISTPDLEVIGPRHNHF